MEILKCNAECGKIYYVEYNNQICECKFIQTFGTGTQCYYILDIAGFGIQRIAYKRQLHFDKWYRTSETDSILYQSIEDYKKHKPINYSNTFHLVIVEVIHILGNGMAFVLLNILYH